MYASLQTSPYLRRTSISHVEGGLDYPRISNLLQSSLLRIPQNPSLCRSSSEHHPIPCWNSRNEALVISSCNSLLLSTSILSSNRPRIVIQLCCNCEVSTSFDLIKHQTIIIILISLLLYAAYDYHISYN